VEVKTITVEGIGADITVALAHVTGMLILGRAFGPKRKRSITALKGEE
jgi:hypothetical protein